MHYPGHYISQTQLTDKTAFHVKKKKIKKFKKGGTGAQKFQNITEIKTNWQF